MAERNYANPGVDAGMQAITARVAGDVASPAMAEPGDEPGGAGLDVMARLAVTLGKLERHLGQPRPLEPRIPYEAAHWIPVPAQAINAAGQVDKPDQLSPEMGYVWHLRRLTVIFGAGTTSVTIYKAAPVDPSNELAQLTASGIYEPSMEFILPSERLVFVSAGGGFTVNGGAVQVMTPWLATYLM